MADQQQHFHMDGSPDPKDGIIKICNLPSDHFKRKLPNRDVYDVDSFITYVSVFGYPPVDPQSPSDGHGQTAIFCSRDGAKAVLDEQENIGYVNLIFRRPLLAKRWLDILGKPFSHREFKEFLELRHAELGELGQKLYLAICNLQLATTFTYDAKLRDDNNYELAIKNEEGGDVIKIPKEFVLKAPLIEGLKANYEIHLRLKMAGVDSSNPTPKFSLFCESLADLLEAAGSDAAVAIKSGLPTFVVVNGNP